MALIEENVYRQQIDETFKIIDQAFEGVDPDLVESIVAQGTLTLLFADGRRCILSPQAPVRQLWVAFKDRAWHLDRDATTNRWMDDRGQGIELYALVEDIVRESAGVTLSIRR
jgi:CyaY protein